GLILRGVGRVGNDWGRALGARGNPGRRFGRWRFRRSAPAWGVVRGAIELLTSCLT
ncbi:MAG: hypothetical protein JWN40_4165, partial [Phycisphaerales bacterium]|nr:hypothetical protein [Phycisphaerales bacterium]